MDTSIRDPNEKPNGRFFWSEEHISSMDLDYAVYERTGDGVEYHTSFEKESVAKCYCNYLNSD
jgi:hypothetical protein